MPNDAAGQVAVGNASKLGDIGADCLSLLEVEYIIVVTDVGHDHIVVLRGVAVEDVHVRTVDGGQIIRNIAAGVLGHALHGVQILVQHNDVIDLIVGAVGDCDQGQIRLIKKRNPLRRKGLRFFFGRLSVDCKKIFSLGVRKRTPFAGFPPSM